MNLIKREVANFGLENGYIITDLSVTRQNLNYKKPSLYPKLLKPAEEVYEVVQELDLKTTLDEPFFYAKDMENGVIIFTCELSIQLFKVPLLFTCFFILLSNLYSTRSYETYLYTFDVCAFTKQSSCEVHDCLMDDSIAIKPKIQKLIII